MTQVLKIDVGSRLSRYTSRCDRHLIKLADDNARLEFLLEQREKWIAARDGFVNLMRSPGYDHPVGGADIHDYNDTIFAISDRIGKYRQRVAGCEPAKAGASLASPAATGSV